MMEFLEVRGCDRWSEEVGVAFTRSENDWGEL
jgi:hypothetical protein